MRLCIRNLRSVLIGILCFAGYAQAQTYERDLEVRKGASIEIVNHFGRVHITAEPEPPAGPGNTKPTIKYTLTASGDKAVSELDIKVVTSSGKTRIETLLKNGGKRLDLTLKLPERARLKIATYAGEVRVVGNIELIDVKTETGTIAVDVPTDDLRYYLQWIASQPRYVSDFELEKVKEKSGGRFEIKGKYAEEKPAKKAGPDPAETDDPEKSDQPTATNATLNLVTDRGIILINVPPNEVSSDLRERPLTNAAKAIIRSGDSLLMEAIRRASPRYFGDYARTLPPLKREPSLTEQKAVAEGPVAERKQVVVRVTDINNRAIAGLEAKDFEVTENNEQREVLSVRPETAPFNLVLLLDVSGSVENYVDFIRKAARNFVDTVNVDDRVSIVIFNEDVKVLSSFTTDKTKLSKSLDSFDAGGGTSYYDSLAYTLTDTLRPLKGERTAIVVLSDGDDNHSFLSFDSLLGSIQESGALVYPLYVPSGLIAASSTANPNSSVDPLRTRYMGLNTKAEGEGEKLAQVSGGVYYPITQLSQLQQAYNDIVVQLRTAYSVTFRSGTSETGDTTARRASPRLKVKVKRENAFVKLGPVVEVRDEK